MSNLASLNVKIDRSLKAEADSIAKAMGMTLSTAINIFICQMVSERAIPFRVHLADDDVGQFHKLIEEMRTEASKRGFISAEEINSEIKATRAEMKDRVV